MRLNTQTQMKVLKWSVNCDDRTSCVAKNKHENGETSEVSEKE